MERQLFVLTFSDDYPYYDHKKIWARDKNEALDIFEATIGVSRQYVTFVETELDWLNKDE